jgi:hypothetical protein
MHRLERGSSPGAKPRGTGLTKDVMASSFPRCEHTELGKWGSIVNDAGPLVELVLVQRWHIWQGGRIAGYDVLREPSLCLKKIEEEVTNRMLALKNPSPPAPLPAAGRGEAGY